jgi:hypothetical protein
MMDPKAAASFWAGESVFHPGRAAELGRPPFALVARGPSSGRDLGAGPAALPGRPALPLKGFPLARMPLLLDATPSGEATSSKGWAAAARGAAGAGAPLLVTPAQLKAREGLLKAAGVPLFLRVTPGEALTPEVAGASAALVVSLSSSRGAPAVLADDGVPGLVEAMRAITQYRAPVLLLAGPGRLPSLQGLAAAADAGAQGVALVEGSGPGRLPLPALVGLAAFARGALPCAFLCLDDLCEGATLALALAAGGGFAASSFPLRHTLAEEAATDADWKATGDRLALALRVMWDDAKQASAGAGVRDPRDLGVENLRALTYDAAALSGLPLAGYEARLPWRTP